MPEVEEYLKLVSSNFRIAEENLADAGEELHTVVGKLEDCLELIAKLRQYEPFSYDAVQSDSKELDLVSV